MTDRNIKMAQSVARAVGEAGGRTYYVGGFVRDRLLGIENKDVDIEIHGIPVETVERILKSVGEPTVMGVSFGVFGLRGYDIDIALPRKETATGRGHRDFAVFVDPFIGTEKAARRRDFTVNAIMQDVLTGQIVDPFGGATDLRNGILRHVSDDSYGEDPLRVLRLAQFAARFGFSVAPETAALSRTIPLDALAGERVMGELSKALLKADTPSVFFGVLRDLGQLSCWFPELIPMIGTPQNPVYHPEGDVFTHTMRVLDAAASLREQTREPLYFLLSALLHDVGKPATTKEIGGKICSYGHEEAGLPRVRSFFSRLTRERALLKYVGNMTLLHSYPNMLFAQRSGEKAYMRLYDRSVCPEDLLMLARADRAGGIAAPYGATAEHLAAMLSLYRERMAAPGVTGEDLVAAGATPSPAFGEALRLAHKLRLSGVGRDAALKQTLAFLRDHREKL